MVSGASHINIPCFSQTGFSNSLNHRYHRSHGSNLHSGWMNIKLLHHTLFLIIWLVSCIEDHCSNFSNSKWMTEFLQSMLQISLCYIHYNTPRNRAQPSDNDPTPSVRAGSLISSPTYLLRKWVRNKGRLILGCTIYAYIYTHGLPRQGKETVIYLILPLKIKYHL